MKTKPIKLFLAAAVLLSSLNSMPRRNAVKAGQRATTWLFVLLLLAAINASLSTCFAQGSLTPPGAPGPMMITLSQMEPRTPIASVPFTITNPGSYYLTTNLTVSSGNAITIATNGVTLDLNGFTISSTAPSATGTGILLGSALTDITILNGHIKGGVTYSGGVYSGSGFANGIYLNGTPVLNVRVTGVSVSGCLNYGIFLGTVNSTLVESCTVLTVGGYGIEASTVVRSHAKICGNVAISADTASDSGGDCSGSGDGLDASFSALNCEGSSISGVGLNADTGSANNCYGVSLNGDGLDATTAQNCSGTSISSGYGINANTAQNCYGSSSSNEGLYASEVATGCYGSSSDNTGLDATTADNCYGISSNGSGLTATTANNCYGYSTSGDGLDGYLSNNCRGWSNGSGTGLSAELASNCYGYSNSGTGLTAFTASICIGITSSGTFLNVTHNVNTY